MFYFQSVIRTNQLFLLPFLCSFVLSQYIKKKNNELLKSKCISVFFCLNYRDVPEDVLNTYCWIHSTFTVVDAFMKTTGTQVAYPGVENYPKDTNNNHGKTPTKQVKYYQWVAFMLFFQVRCFLCFFLHRNIISL